MRTYLFSSAGVMSDRQCHYELWMYCFYFSLEQGLTVVTNFVFIAEYFRYVAVFLQTLLN